MSRYIDTPARLRVTVDSDDLDTTFGHLWAAGTSGIEERDRDDGRVDLLAVFPTAVAADAAASRLDGFTIVEELIAGDHRTDAWRDHAEPVKVGNRLVVCPSWVSYDVEPVELVLRIDPGPLFGSGSHTSTRQALATLERVLEGNERVLDVGCGSGILAVAAARLGAVDVTAVDTDGRSPAVVADNARRNGVADAVTATVDGLETLSGPYDLIVANMLRSEHLQVAHHYRDLIGPRGLVIVAGILADQLDDVEGAAGLRRLDVTVDDGWACATLARP